MERYIVLREEGLGMEQALVFVGHHLRMFHLRHLNLGRVRELQRHPWGAPVVRRKDSRMDTSPSASMGFLSGLEAQSELSELLDELYGDDPM